LINPKLDPLLNTAEAHGSKLIPHGKYLMFFIKAPDWKTTTQSNFVDPKILANPTYRDSKNNQEYRKLPALSSGFSTNRAY
jgi:hypothetical protein